MAWNTSDNLKTFENDFTPYTVELKEGQLLGVNRNYRLEKNLGVGGMGEVWLAAKILEGEKVREVVVKTLRPDRRGNEGAQEKALKQFQLIQTLNHTNICPIYDIEKDPACGYLIVMGYAGGGSYADWFSGQPKPLAEVCRVLRPIADALDFAHSKGVIHRDVKPANMMFTSDGTPWLIDFGIAARLRSESMATQGQFTQSGTVSYMAPEQKTGEFQTAQTDEYALAMVALEFLTGTTFLQAVQTLSLELQHVLNKALAMKPSNRFPTCRAFIDALAGTTLPASSKIRKDVGLPSAAGPAAKKPKDLKWVWIPALLVLLAVLFLIFRSSREQFPPEPEPAVAVEESAPAEPAVAVEESAPAEPAPAVEESVPAEPAPAVEESAPAEPAQVVEEPAAAEEPAPPAVEEPAEAPPLPESIPELVKAPLEKWKQDLLTYENILVNYTPESPKATAQVKVLEEGFLKFRTLVDDYEERRNTEYKSMLAEGVKPGAPMMEKLERELDFIKRVTKILKPEFDITTQQVIFDDVSIEVVGLDPGSRRVWTVDGINYAFRWCPPGEFMMGSTNGDSDEKPVHKVTLTRGFWLLETEVTQAMWESVMGENLSEFKGDRNPVECVSWDDSQEFCKKLSQKLGRQVQLPTEAQWEYACRTGTTGDYAGTLDEMAWYSSNSGGTTHAVGQKKPNAWGLYDMHGNVWEWCSDYLDKEYYSRSPMSDPENTTASSSRVLRGGCWELNARYCRSACRYSRSPDFRYYDLGLRIILVPNPDE
ncbi:MAG: SUMF1/EgtB/PvdO family nonheme iron enzyme [Thermoguttaceae bacterium]|nr:SUMF1/EgtB/PvdO family nonheme iron enzyme [Thermoguttaceae bacterium]